MSCYLLTFQLPALAFIVSLLTGKAFDWVSLLWEKSDLILFDYTKFLASFCNIFEEPGCPLPVSYDILRIRQSNRSVGKYVIQFRTLAANLNWNEGALIAAFWNGLSDRIKDDLATRDQPPTLDSLISLCNRVDIRQWERLSERAKSDRSKPRPRPRSPSPQPTTEEPMQIGQSKLSAQEKARWRKENLCLYCADKAHSVTSCPSPSGKTPPPSLFKRGQARRHWSPHCLSNCMKKVLPVHSVQATIIPDRPAEYQDFSNVFREQAADVLPPHREWDCPVDLIPGKTPPRG